MSSVCGRSTNGNPSSIYDTPASSLAPSAVEENRAVLSTLRYRSVKVIRHDYLAIMQDSRRVADSQFARSSAVFFFAGYETAYRTTGVDGQVLM